MRVRNTSFIHSNGPRLLPVGGSAVEVSIVIPCLNEGRTLESCIQKASKTLSEMELRWEIIVADNGSIDESCDIAMRTGAVLVRVAERGYGSAVMAGIARACGRFVIMGDGDGSYDFSEIAVFVDRLRGGFDLVIGNRFKGRIAPGAMPLLNRYVGNPVLSGLGRILYAPDCGDFHCGLRAFHREAILGLNLRAKGMEFASEMVIRATMARLSVCEVPISLQCDGRCGSRSHLRPWRDGCRHLQILLRYKADWVINHWRNMFRPNATELATPARKMSG